MASSAAQVWPADLLDEGLFGLHVGTAWEWLPLLEAVKWSFVPTSWTILPTGREKDYGFLALRQDGATIPVVVQALSRRTPRLLSALRPSLCQLYPFFATLAEGSDMEAKEVALIKHLLQHLPQEVLQGHVSACRSVWRGIKEQAAKRAKKKEASGQVEEENEGESEADEEAVPEEILDFVYAAVDGIDSDQLGERDKKQFKSSEAMEKRCRERASALLQGMKAKLRCQEAEQTDQPEVRDNEGNSASVPPEGEEMKAPEAGEDSKTLPGERQPYTRKSDLRWVAPFVPDAPRKCSLSTGKASQFVARNHVELEEAPAELKQKTKSAMEKDDRSLHAAFLVCLEWLWKKHCLWSKEERPAHVQKALLDTDCCNSSDRKACHEKMKELERIGLRFFGQNAGPRDDCHDRTEAPGSGRFLRCFLGPFLSA